MSTIPRHKYEILENCLYYDLAMLAIERHHGDTYALKGVAPVGSNGYVEITIVRTVLTQLYELVIEQFDSLIPPIHGNRPFRLDGTVEIYADGRQDAAGKLLLKNNVFFVCMDSKLKAWNDSRFVWDPNVKKLQNLHVMSEDHLWVPDLLTDRYG